MPLYDVCMLRVLKAELCCCVSVTYHAVLIIKTVFVFSLELLQIGDEDGIPAKERKVMVNGGKLWPIIKRLRYVYVRIII